jgi:hypothetical protein
MKTQIADHSGYVFGHRPGGGVLFIHRHDCFHLSKEAEYRECPLEVAAHVGNLAPDPGFRRPIRITRTRKGLRSLALCPHCIGLDAV